SAMIWIGTISYPLYLWHWPILSFAYIVDPNYLTIFGRLVALASSIVLAWLTVVLIERPARTAGHMSPSCKVAGLLAGSFIIGGVGYAVNVGAGLPNRASIVNLAA